jgi:hypothetical protein
VDFSFLSGPLGGGLIALLVFLLTRQHQLNQDDTDAAAVPLVRPVRPPSGGSVRELRLGELIGRRFELRTALRVLRAPLGSRPELGAVTGVLLTGIGGIGKTAVAGRIMSRLADENCLIVLQVRVLATSARKYPISVTSIWCPLASLGWRNGLAHAFEIEVVAAGWIEIMTR